MASQIAWYPDAEKIPLVTGDGGSYFDAPFRIILHTTESKNFYPSTTSYYGHRNAPHFTVHNGKIWQHFPLNRAARALENRAGGVQTNRECAIQFEIAWLASDINNMFEANWIVLREAISWLCKNFSINKYCPPFGGPDQYGLNNTLELSPEEWNAFSGVCGHQHVPENVHWDPGAISRDRLKWLGLAVIDDLRMRPFKQEPELHKEQLPTCEAILSFLRSLKND